MVAQPAVVIACDVSGGDRVIATTGEAAADYRAARAYALSVGWVTSSWEHGWCLEHGFAYGGDGLANPYEHLGGQQ